MYLFFKAFQISCDDLIGQNKSYKRTDSGFKIKPIQLLSSRSSHAALILSISWAVDFGIAGRSVMRRYATSSSVRKNNNLSFQRVKLESSNQFSLNTSNIWLKIVLLSVASTIEIKFLKIVKKKYCRIWERNTLALIV